MFAPAEATPLVSTSMGWTAALSRAVSGVAKSWQTVAATSLLVVGIVAISVSLAPAPGASAAPAPAAAPTTATAVVNNGTIMGIVSFTQAQGSEVVAVSVRLAGVAPGNANHGFHIHASGDLTAACAASGAHFNPFFLTHGFPTNLTARHVGDLGNVFADADGVVAADFTDSVISLRDATRGIVGRSVMLHAAPDDGGLGGQADSLTTGHAGARIAGGTIVRTSAA